MKNLQSGCENWMWNPVVVVYMTTDLSENRVSLKKVKIW
jgi:hypothetical protein